MSRGIRAPGPPMRCTVARLMGQDGTIYCQPSSVNPRLDTDHLFHARRAWSIRARITFLSADSFSLVLSSFLFFSFFFEIFVGNLARCARVSKETYTRSLVLDVSRDAARGWSVMHSRFNSLWKVNTSTISFASLSSLLETRLRI